LVSQNHIKRSLAVVTMALMTDEQRRHTLECEYWWRITKGKPSAIRDVLERIEQKRGKAGMERVRAGLMEIYKQQKEQRK
jgi:hypothetical protein